jgi:ribonuclease HI
MDDSILLFDNTTTAQTQTAEIAMYFQSLGWTLALNKCQMTPTQQMEFLGWSWNLRDRQLTIPVKRQNALIAELKQWIDKARKRESCPIRELAALLGRLSHLRFQIVEASLYMRRTIQMMSRARVSATWTGNCTITPAILGELKWWARRISRNAPRSLAPRLQTLLITTDASPSGWGAELESHGRTTYTFGTWNADERGLTSNAKELTAVRKALQQAAKLKLLNRGSEVLVRSDNTTTVFLIKRWSACLSLVSHLRQLFNLIRKRDILLRATYLPGVLNSTADKLSRLGNAMDFSLNREAFLHVTQECHLVPEIDVFAEAENHLCDAYASLSPRDGAAIAVDGMTIPWTNRAVWLHPPINLISRVLVKLETEKTRAILVAPAWEGQPWSPRLTQYALRHIDLGEYEHCMIPGRKFREEEWLFPPGHARATLLDTKMTPGKSS